MIMKWMALLALAVPLGLGCSSGAVGAGGGGAGAGGAAASSGSGAAGRGAGGDGASAAGGAGGEATGSGGEATGSGGMGGDSTGVGGAGGEPGSGGSGGGGNGQTTGLEWTTNGVAGSDARLVWSGSNMLPRTSHTAIWKARYIQQSGYYAVAWHTSNDGTWHASYFELGTHPYPTTGTLNSSGQSTGGTGSSGLVHFYEIAGLGASDFIASPGPGPTYPVTKGVWVTQARTSEIVGGNTVRHRYWPDVSNPSGYIEQSIPKSGYDAAAASAVSPAFTIGGSPWTGNGSSNSESPGAVLRGFALFDAPLTIADIAAEAQSDASTPVTTAGAQAVFYINKNPTPTDVSDKSGAGHSPTWANAQRPMLVILP
ncbi:MAG: hypothetical protein KC731_02770 [Myxococcales bacterium]|nr:hypothetical protein [Myxococcales bacterium]